MRKRYAPLFLLALLAPASAMAFSVSGSGYNHQAAYQNVLQQINNRCPMGGYISSITYHSIAGGVIAVAQAQCGKGLSPSDPWN